MLDWISPLGISRSALNLGGLRVRRDKPARVFAGSPASDISAPLLNGARALLYASREFSWMHLAFLALANCLESVGLIFSLQDTGGIPRP